MLLQGFDMVSYIAGHRKKKTWITDCQNYGFLQDLVNLHFKEIQSDQQKSLYRICNVLKEETSDASRVSLLHVYQSPEALWCQNSIYNKHIISQWFGNRGHLTFPTCLQWIRQNMLESLCQDWCLYSNTANTNLAGWNYCKRLLYWMQI